MWVAIGIVVVLVLFGVYLASTAGRLDRLHHRVDTAYASLNAQLLRRSTIAFELAMSGELDPAASLVLADAAIRAQENDGDPVDRAQPESDLTKAIVATIGSKEAVDLLFASEGGTTLGNQLSSAVHRTAISRRFYNDAVRACRAVRRQHLVRWFSLAGHTPMPQTVEMDDEVPSGFEGR
ncbi:MAG: hypothetical protein WC054_12480 [Candidatus Nanopelagicales bacterium]